MSTPTPARKTDEASTTDRATPFLELRVGGLHLTIQRAPVGLFLVLTALSGSGVTGWWAAQ